MFYLTVWIFAVLLVNASSKKYVVIYSDFRNLILVNFSLLIVVVVVVVVVAELSFLSSFLSNVFLLNI